MAGPCQLEKDFQGTSGGLSQAGGDKLGDGGGPEGTCLTGLLED